MNIDTFRIAKHLDAEEITQLVNAAYRPSADTAGWTHEADLVSGKRITHEQLINNLSKPQRVILVAVQGLKIVACIDVEKQGNASYIGMLAVSPPLQSSGIGKQLLNYAEQYARQYFNADKFVMWVLSPRTELIAFYLRRGYQKTDAVIDFPPVGSVGTPKQAGLKLAVLEKSATLDSFLERINSSI